jgi:hypothetical protein
MPRKKLTETESKERARVRLDPDIEDYLKSQSERVLSKPASQLDGADLTTLANRILYEHKQANQLAKALPLARCLNSLMSWFSGNSGKVVALSQTPDAPALKPSNPELQDDFGFDADLSDMYEEEAA